jgi:hypothetical protein
MFEGLKKQSITPMTACLGENSEEPQRFKDIFPYKNDPMPKEIGIDNEDLMLIPKFFLDKEDPELALKMERTLSSAGDYGS